VSVVIYIGLFILILLLQFRIMVNVMLCIVTFFHTIVIILVHLIYIHTSKTLGTNMSHAIFFSFDTRIVIVGYLYQRTGIFPSIYKSGGKKLSIMQ
jgi:hypothetical protein